MNSIESLKNMILTEVLEGDMISDESLDEIAARIRKEKVLIRATFSLDLYELLIRARSIDPDIIARSFSGIEIFIGSRIWPEHTSLYEFSDGSAEIRIFGKRVSTLDFLTAKKGNDHEEK